jgi:hypothetical protein
MPTTIWTIVPAADDDECEAVGETGIGKGNRSSLGDLPRCDFIYDKSHMTSTELEPGPPRWKAIGLSA